MSEALTNLTRQRLQNAWLLPRRLYPMSEDPESTSEPKKYFLLPVIFDVRAVSKEAATQLVKEYVETLNVHGIYQVTDAVTIEIDE
jgi:hypothetical protein